MELLPPVVAGQRCVQITIFGAMGLGLGPTEFISWASVVGMVVRPCKASLVVTYSHDELVDISAARHWEGTMNGRERPQGADIIRLSHIWIHRQAID